MHVLKAVQILLAVIAEQIAALLAVITAILAALAMQMQVAAAHRVVHVALHNFHIG